MKRSEFHAFRFFIALTALPFRSWMGLFVNIEQFRGRQVRVDLRGFETFVPQEFLNASNIRPAVKQMSGKTVSERVG